MGRQQPAERRTWHVSMASALTRGTFRSPLEQGPPALL